MNKLTAVTLGLLVVTNGAWALFAWVPEGERPCGHEEEIFGKGGGRRTSDRYGVPFLGSVPIEARVRECGDQGRPVVVAHPDSASAAAFDEVAEGVERFLKATMTEASAN